MNYKSIAFNKFKLCYSMFVTIAPSLTRDNNQMLIKL